MKNTGLILLSFLLCSTLLAADREIGFEGQLYPTGSVAAVRAKLPAGENGFVTLRAGYNDVDRDDDGERDDEEGGGPGLSVGYRGMLDDGDRGWFAGARADLWFLDIDWIDAPGTPGERSGSTDVVVFQPTVEVGYAIPFGRDQRWSFEPAVSFGVEINADTDGEDVGQGAILLFGATVSRRF